MRHMRIRFRAVVMAAGTPMNDPDDGKYILEWYMYEQLKIIYEMGYGDIAREIGELRVLDNIGVLRGLTDLEAAELMHEHVCDILQAK